MLGYDFPKGPVELMADECSEHDQRGRIVPEPLAQQADDQPKFNRSVAQEIDRRKVLRSNREMSRGVQEIVRDQIARVLRQLTLGQRGDKANDELPLDQKNKQASEDFQQGKRALQEETDLEDQMDSVFVQELSGIHT
jgi:hypothetical protein